MEENIIAPDGINVEAEISEKKVKSIFPTIIELLFYSIGLVFIILCFVKLSQDLNTYDGEYWFSVEEYVGGEVFNYIISATRSIAVMVKSLIYGVLGCSSFICGLLVKIASGK